MIHCMHGMSCQCLYFIECCHSGSDRVVLLDLLNSTELHKLLAYVTYSPEIQDILLYGIQSMLLEPNKVSQQNYEYA